MHWINGNAQLSRVLKEDSPQFRIYVHISRMFTLQENFCVIDVHFLQQSKEVCSDTNVAISTMNQNVTALKKFKNVHSVMFISLEMV